MTALALNTNNKCKFPLINFVKNSLDNVGLFEHFVNQNVNLYMYRYFNLKIILIKAN